MNYSECDMKEILAMGNFKSKKLRNRMQNQNPFTIKTPTKHSYIQRKAVLCASGADGVDGLISGHAYSIIHYFQNDEKRLVKIRNPWGTGEWTGDWSKRF